MITRKIPRPPLEPLVPRLSARSRVLLTLGALLVPLLFLLPGGSTTSQAQSTTGPTVSTPITLDRTGQNLWAVNPDSDTISVIAVSAANGTHAAEIAVGREPQSIAISTNNLKAYVANARDGTVSVIATDTKSTLKTIHVGVEPWALALTPNGTKLYVTNSSSGTVSIIDTGTDEVIKTLYRVGFQPRALAISSDGDSDDTDEKVYVASFLAQYRPGEVRPGEDQGKVGVVTVLSTATDEIVKTIQLQPLADTGFKSDGDAFNKIAPTGTATIVTGAFPNILAGMAWKGTRLYVAETGSSPNGPVKFNVNVQGLVSVIDTITDTDAGKTVNLNKGVQFEAASVDGLGRPVHRFVTNPYGLAFRNGSNSGYVVSAASDMIVKMDLSSDGTPTINAPPASGQPGNIKRIFTGSNPRAMVIDSADRLGYVWDYVARDVAVVDLATDTFVKGLVLSNQPVDATAIRVQAGKLLFNTSIGPVVTGSGVMSDSGWVACASCHPNGLTDAVVWMFPSGPRLTTPLNATFDASGSNQRALNWSAIFDEVADFELNTRGVAGGRGLILLSDGTSDPNVKAFDPKSGGRNDLRDSITDYVKAVRSPISPILQGDLRAGEGRKVFVKAGCATCHGGSNWTSSHLEFTPPPPATALVTEQGTAQLVGQLEQVGTFNAALPFELIGTGANISKQALGASGFNPPSLRSIFAFGPYLHNGSAATLDELLDNKTHVGSSQLLDSPVKRKQLVQFLRSIDDSTPPIGSPPSEKDTEHSR